jgi:DNA-binding NarL/FixJ family response regulator
VTYEPETVSRRRYVSAEDWATLTPGERAVAALVAEGLRNAAVAAELSLSVATVKTHLSRAFRKLGVASRAELAASRPLGVASD